MNSNDKNSAPAAGRSRIRQRVVGGFRILTTRIAGGVTFLLLLLSEHRWSEGGVVDVFLELAGVLLIVLGTFGRMWCSLFISGYKTKHLISVGPFSVVRNPLYVFSFIGAVGVALSTEMVTFAVLVVLLFALYYPTVILLEERKLKEVHGEEFEAYCRRVPRLIPKISLYEEPETYLFNTRLFRKAFLDGIWFILLYPVLEVIERFHELKWLPALFELY